MDELDPDDPRPPYQQLSNCLRAAIEAGDYRPGQQLPSHQRLADTYGVAVGTVKRALGVLREQGLITTRHGMGSYVRAHASGESTDARQDELTEIHRTLATLGERLDAVERRLSGR
ncbi:MAG TPA: GntR family transcriptional regulator [Pseudonocardiaceae bacterium]|nr:GntR family transcriptional regulator [Pseudonocardiaceae bacterium]